MYDYKLIRGSAIAQLDSSLYEHELRFYIIFYNDIS